jgi:hypothetical protein
MNLTDEEYKILEEDGGLMKEVDGEKCEVILLKKGPHYAQLQKNGQWLEYIRAPENKDKRPKNKFKAKDVVAYHKFPEMFCFWCGKKEYQLSEKETFECDHIVMIINGGKDTIENTQTLCSCCHKSRHHNIHWGQARYFSKMKKEGSK